ncbi:hypothetical protein [Methanothrix sp.]|jgi:hypothetical protein|uniref:hypothetical protein n=1 Tax=Methanothrix sp. TaxID=90426 RepID=UPI001BD4E57E
MGDCTGGVAERLDRGFEGMEQRREERGEERRDEAAEREGRGEDWDQIIAH